MNTDYTYKRVCPECDGTFETSRVNQRFDNDKCRIDFNNRKIYERAKTHRGTSTTNEALQSAIADFINSIVYENTSGGEAQRAYTEELIERFQKIYDGYKK